ncbi:MAG TPA: hypothetical protein VMU22_10005 [Rhizomicrobium sp.]|nr:hypothetical protein [Rhizomicrobium sp.]
MNSRAIDPKIIADLSRYTAEELDPQLAEDESAMDAYIARNRDALNKALEAGYVSLESGDGIAIRSLEDLLLALETARARR